MKTLEEIREFFQGDRFAMEQGIVIERAEDGRAVCSMEITPRHLNAVGNVQGGLIFTLADFAFAVAVNCQKVGTVTLDSSIHYLRRAQGSRLTATAVPAHQGGSICLYEVAVRDEVGEMVAKASITGYSK